MTQDWESGEMHVAVVIEVQDAPELRDSWYGEMIGVVGPLLKWSTELAEPAEGGR